MIVSILLHHHQHDATLLRVNVTPVDHHSIQTVIPLLTLHAVTENAIIATVQKVSGSPPYAIASV